MEAVSLPPGSDVLGFSYDVFGHYANPKSVKQPLFEFAPATVEVELGGRPWFIPEDFAFEEIDSAPRKTTICERTQDEYSRALAASCMNKPESGGGFHFHDSIDSAFSDAVTHPSDSCYTSVFATVCKWKFSLEDNVHKLRKKLVPSVKVDLMSMPPVELFENYGTHFLNEVMVGGRANYVAVTHNVRDFGSTDDIRKAAEFSFNKITGLGSLSKEQEKLVTRFRHHSRVAHLFTTGGTSSPDIRSPEEYTKWKKSVDDRPVFCAFTKTYTSLLPIYELVDSPQRRRELQNAAKHFVPISVTRPAVVGLQIISSLSGDDPPPYLYNKVNHDLNEGAEGNEDNEEDNEDNEDTDGTEGTEEGKFVYLYYKKLRVSASGRRKSDPKPITDLHIAASETPDIQCPPGYTKIDIDLNKGVAGSFIYLCYTTDPAKAREKDKDGLPIRSVCVISSDDPNIPAPYGFTRIGVDLNYGAGGKRIYLCYSRHVDSEP